MTSLVFPYNNTCIHSQLYVLGDIFAEALLEDLSPRMEPQEIPVSADQLSQTSLQQLHPSDTVLLTASDKTDTYKENEPVEGPVEPKLDSSKPDLTDSGRYQCKNNTKG